MQIERKKQNMREKGKTVKMRSEITFPNKCVAERETER